MPASQQRSGVIFAILAYTMWGFAPVYFKQLESLPSSDILMHRILWSAAVLVIFVFLFKQIKKFNLALGDRRVLLTLFASGLLLAGNWLLFIWAINNDRLLEASLGYYINPLLNVFLGRLFLGERLTRLQQYAVLIAIVGVGILLIAHAKLPWIALLLAGSFGIYGLIRKQVKVDSLPGLTIETLMMLPFALIYWLYFATSASSDMLNNSANLNLLLISAGLVTTLPLLSFTAAARRIAYSTLGFFQYIGPSLMFILATYIYAEPMDNARWWCFAFVWVALALFSFDAWRGYKKRS
jgi:chloramphenicol-sensitive protein RarD